MMQCLLCSSSKTWLLKSYSVQEIIQEWQTTFGIDITSEFGEEKSFDLHCCLECDLRFFPPHLAGSENLYIQLQALDFYYPPHKWEYERADADIIPGSHILEIGCGKGDFLDWICKRKQLDIMGIELNSLAVEEANKLCRPVFLQDLDERARSGSKR